jgi:hypothetical protein
MVKELSFLCFLTAMPDTFEWRAKHQEPEHTKLMNIAGTQKVRLKYCQYKYYDKGKTIYSTMHHRHIYYTLVRNRSTNAKH